MRASRKIPIGTHNSRSQVAAKIARYLHSAESHLLPVLSLIERSPWHASTAVQRNSAREVNSETRTMENDDEGKEGDRGKLTRHGNSKKERGSIDARIVSLRPWGDESLSPFSLSLFLSWFSPFRLFPCVLFSPGIAEVAETTREAKRGMQAMLLRQHPHLFVDDALGRIHHVADRRVSRYHRVCRANILQVFVMMWRNTVRRSMKLKLNAQSRSDRSIFRNIDFTIAIKTN